MAALEEVIKLRIDGDQVLKELRRVGLAPCPAWADGQHMFRPYWAKQETDEFGQAAMTFHPTVQIGGSVAMKRCECGAEVKRT